MRMKIGNWYKFRDPNLGVHIGQYMGKQEGFECCVCGKGHNAYTFNIWYAAGDFNYETWGYGKEHLDVIEDLGPSDDVILDKE